MKNKVTKLLNVAAKMSRLKDDCRHFFIGAVAIRGDDVTVYSYNGAPKFPERQHHAEARIARKLDKGATVFVARTMANGEWACSKPCANCTVALKRAYVKKVYYTIAAGEYGCMEF